MIATLVLNFWQVELNNSGIELVELVSYCANKCRATCTFFCGTVAGHLDHIAGDLPQVSCSVIYGFCSMVCHIIV